jgi:hypothetical protein
MGPTAGGYRIAELQFENSRLRRPVTDPLLEKIRLEDAAKNPFARTRLLRIFILQLLHSDFCKQSAGLERRLLLCPLLGDCIAKLSLRRWVNRDSVD